MYYIDISINFLANPTFKRPPKALKVCRKAVTHTTVTISTIYTITRVDYAIYHRKSCFSLIMILNYNLAHFMTALQIKRFLMIKKRHVHWRHLLMCTACTCTGYFFSLEVLKVSKVSFFLEKSRSGTG